MKRHVSLTPRTVLDTVGTLRLFRQAARLLHDHHPHPQQQRDPAPLDGCPSPPDGAPRRLRKSVAAGRYVYPRAARSQSGGVAGQDHARWVPECSVAD